MSIEAALGLSMIVGGVGLLTGFFFGRVVEHDWWLKRR